MDCIWNGSYILFAVAVMLLTEPALAARMIALLAVCTLAVSIFQKKLIAVNRRIREINSRITGNFNEGITGARSVKILGIEEIMQKEFESDTEKMRAQSVRAVKHSAMLISTVTLMSSFALALVLWQGGMMTRAGLMKIGTLSVFFSYAVGMMEPLQFIIQNVSAFIGIQANIERFTDLLAEPSDVTDTPEVIARYGDGFHPRYENWEEIKGDIEFEDVTFRCPDGLDSDVGEGGSSLSTGEKQLLSFARALLADPRLLILDEATSSIDTLTETAIQKAISVVTRNRTSFVIAHRLSTIVSADLILVVRDGKITERGTHSELMARKGYYYSLYTMQYVKEIPAM